MIWILPGFVSASVVNFNNTHDEGIFSYAVRVERAPRYRKSGGIDLLLAYKTSNVPLKKLISCRAAHLPWRNVIHIQRGDYAQALLKIGNGGRHCKLLAISYPSKRNITNPLQSFRKKLLDDLREKLGAGEGVGALFALTIGYQDGLYRESDNMIRALGISHLFVVSGLHFTFVFLLIRFFLSACIRIAGQLIISHSLFIYVPASIVMFLYLLLLTEGQASLRAFMMIILLGLGRALGLKISFFDAFLLSSFLLFLASPQDAFGVGGALSLFALLGIWAIQYAEIRGKLFSAVTLWLFTCVPAIFVFERFCWLGSLSTIVLGPPLMFVGTGGGLAGMLLYMTGLDSNCVLLRLISSILSQILKYLRLIVDATPLSLCLDTAPYSSFVSISLLCCLICTCLYYFAPKLAVMEGVSIFRIQAGTYKTKTAKYD